MIHIIYIILILNALITGMSDNSFKSDFDGYKYVLAIIVGLLFAAPYAILFFLYEFLKRIFQSTWLYNFIYVYRVKHGFVKLNKDGIEYITKHSEYLKTKKKLSKNQKIFIWGAKHITNYYYSKQSTL